MDLHCRPRTDENGNKVTWSGDGIPNEMLYGPNGWCESDEPAIRCAHHGVCSSHGNLMTCNARSGVQFGPS